MWTLKFPVPGAARISSILLAGLGLGLSGCSLSSSNGDSSIYVDLSSLRGGSRFALLDQGGPVYGLGAPPSSASGFTCYAVNVTGPGIGDSSPNPHPGAELGAVFDHLLTKQSYCSYRGVVSPTISLAAAGASNVALQVPPGGVRLVQIAGVNDPLVCASGVINDPPGSVSGNRYFEVGRAVLNDVFGDRSVDVAMDWPSTATERAARQMDCGDGVCGVVSGVQSGASVGSLASYEDGMTYNRIGFKLNVPAGKRIMKLNLLLGTTYNAPVPTTVELRKNTGSGTVDLGVAAAVYASATVSVAALTPTPQLYTFDLRDAAGNYVVADGSDYWILINSPGTSVSTPILVAHNTGTDNGSVKQFITSVPRTGQPVTSSGIIYELTGCGN